MVLYSFIPPPWETVVRPEKENSRSKKFSKVKYKGSYNQYIRK